MNVLITIGVYFMLVVAALLGIEAGRWLGRITRDRKTSEASETLGSNLGGLLALLAFMLALTFSITSDRFSRRKALVLEEANALSTAYLRADFLARRDSQRVQQRLFELVQARTDESVTGRPSPAALDAVRVRSERLRERLWRDARTARRGFVDAELYALFLGSVNRLIDVSTERETVILVHRVPTLVWGVLATISMLSMIALGYQGGVRDRARAMSSFALALAFAAVFALCIDMDRQSFGFATISQQPMLDVRAQIARDIRQRPEEEAEVQGLVRHR